MCKIASRKLLFSTGSSAGCTVMHPEGWYGEDICIHIADSLHYTAETNIYIIVKQLYFNNKIKGIKSIFKKNKCSDHNPKQPKIYNHSY